MAKRDPGVVSADIKHPLFARLFARLAPRMEAQGAGEHRDRLLAGLGGRVLELGAGSGINFAHYPSTVSEVVAVEPEPYLRTRAEVAAKSSAVRVSVVEGTADRLPADDESFDAAVASLVLCSVPSQPVALAELRRVLIPGGELRFYEHVVASEAKLSRLQNRIDWVWPHFAGGCHPNRDTVGAIERAGFELERCERFRFQPSPPMIPVAPHVIGIARKPA